MANEEFDLETAILTITADKTFDGFAKHNIRHAVKFAFARRDASSDALPFDLPPAVRDFTVGSDFDSSLRFHIAQAITEVMLQAGTPVRKDTGEVLYPEPPVQPAFGC
jgi:hypothetical protein